MNENKYGMGQMKDILTLADNYAKNNSTCKKTVVGCYLIHEDPQWRKVLAKGCNNSKESCKDLGCLREEIFGDNSKEHRKTCRCAKNHAEIDALSRVPKDKRKFLPGSTAFVTRYPCEECTKALVEAGVKRIVYGRPFPMSEESVSLATDAGIEIIWIKDWNCDENDTNN